MHKRVQQPRILILSLRDIFSKALFRGPLYEFEDLVTTLDSAEMLVPQADISSSRHMVAKRLAFHAPIALNPGIPPIRVKQKYDLFIMMCGAPADLLMLNAVANWREACKTAVCLIDELWVKQMVDYRHFLRPLKAFDVVLLYYSQSVKALSELIGRKCVFLPPGVDAIRFCPYPELPKRVIDVYSIGRRSDITHKRLLQMSNNDGLLYLYDTVAGDQAINLMEHRRLIRSLTKRSRFFMVNPGLIDRPDIRGSQIEVGNRYFEGAASGTVMVGERPSNEAFERLFDWPDAVIHVPYDSNNIDTFLHELDKDPTGLDRIRQQNLVHALTRHDWAYRWGTILEAIGLEPMPELVQRKDGLRILAESISEHKLSTR
jgi:hypothetical protein